MPELEVSSMYYPPKLLGDDPRVGYVREIVTQPVMKDALFTEAPSSAGLLGKGRARSDASCAAFVVINLTAAVDSADASLLHSVHACRAHMHVHTCRAHLPCTPAQVFRALEADLQLGPSALSSLALLQSLSMAVAAPVWLGLGLGLGLGLVTLDGRCCTGEMCMRCAWRDMCMYDVPSHPWHAHLSLSMAVTAPAP